MHYVIGDVHGCLNEMLLLIGKIESKDPDAEFIFVGDFIDRGEQVWETYLWVKENITENGKFRSVRGNHEQMAIDWMKDYMVWLQGKNIFGEPPYYFDFDRALYANRNPEIIRKENFCPEDFKEIMECFEALPFDIRVPVTTNGERKSPTGLCTPDMPTAKRISACSMKSTYGTARRPGTTIHQKLLFTGIHRPLISIIFTGIRPIPIRV